MKTKPCIKCCNTLAIDDFYVHKAMADGHLNKCKSCCRADAIANRRSRLEYYREYDRKRLSSERRKQKLVERQKRYRTANATKNAARSAVARAIRSGKLVRGACAVCGAREVDAHHDDYSRPLAVTWLCRQHHLHVHGLYITSET